MHYNIYDKKIFLHQSKDIKKKYREGEHKLKQKTKKTRLQKYILLFFVKIKAQGKLKHWAHL